MRGGSLQYPQGRASTGAAWVIIGIGVLFAGLWLSELVPALVSGRVPVSLAEAGLWVNPIHVIDLSIVLPGFIVAGVAALGRREHGLFWLAPWLVFASLMGSSILAAMALMMMAGATSSAPADSDGLHRGRSQSPGRLALSQRIDSLGAPDTAPASGHTSDRPNQ